MYGAQQTKGTGHAASPLCLPHDPPVFSKGGQHAPHDPPAIFSNYGYSVRGLWEKATKLRNASRAFPFGRKSKISDFAQQNPPPATFSKTVHLPPIKGRANSQKTRRGPRVPVRRPESPSLGPRIPVRQLGSPPLGRREDTPVVARRPRRVVPAEIRASQSEEKLRLELVQPVLDNIKGHPCLRSPIQKTGDLKQKPIQIQDQGRTQQQAASTESVINGSPIGSGARATVYNAFKPTTGQIFATKVIQLAGLDEYSLRLLQRELYLATHLKHPNIVKYYGVKISDDDQYLTITMEYVCGGSLDRIVRSFGSIPEPVILKYLRHIVNGLSYIHDQGIIHGDIKCNNILVSNCGTCKLSDFGSSIILNSQIGKNPDVTNEPLYGTPFWMAPEAFKQSPLDQQADMWSLGACIIEMITGKIPFTHLADNQLGYVYFLSQAESERKLLEFPGYQDVSPFLTDIIRRLICFDPNQRFTSRQLGKLLENV